MALQHRGAAIVGIYTTEQGRFLKRSSTSLEIEAIKGALDDAGLTLADVDGIVAPITMDATGFKPPSPQHWAAQLGGKSLTYFDGAGGHLGAQRAAAAITAGLANVVILFHGKAHLEIGPRGNANQPVNAEAWEGAAWGGYMATWYAMWARRYMHEFGITSEDLGQVPVIQRYHATLNPASLMGSRGELTVEQVLDSRLVADPLHLLDCALDNDGGWAIVIAAGDIARDCRRKPIWIIGGAEAVDADLYKTIDAPWIGRQGSAARRVGEIAFAQAGISRCDVDVANLYDCFSITFLRDLEELGFCALGEASDYVRAGHTRLGGSMPCNTDGGLLSNTHNGNPTGMMAIEVVRQLRGDAGARQVPDARIGFAFSQGAAVHGVCGSVILAAD
ncbi:MAG: thiolase family protein [Thermomicrobiales bacterium]